MILCRSKITCILKSISNFNTNSHNSDFHSSDLVATVTKSYSFYRPNGARPHMTPYVILPRLFKDSVYFVRSHPLLEMHFKLLPFIKDNEIISPLFLA